MILPDSSVWIDHLRHGEPRLVECLTNAEVLFHPFVVGEIALGSLARRHVVIDVLQALPVALIARHEEVMAFIEREQLHSRGIGYIDVHLLASARLSDAPSGPGIGA